MKKAEKMLTGYTKAGKPIYRIVPEITHPYVAGDIILDPDLDAEFILFRTDEIVLKGFDNNPLNGLDIRISGFRVGGSMQPSEFKRYRFHQEFNFVGWKKVGTVDPDTLNAILAAEVESDKEDAAFWERMRKLQESY